MSTLKETAVHSAIYSLGNLAVKLAGLLLFPVITENLNISEYGSYSLIESINQIIVGVLSLKLPVAALRFASDKSGSADQKAVFSNALLVLLAVSGSVAGIAYLLQDPLSQLITGAPGNTWLVALLAASITAEMMGLVPIQFLRLKDRSVTYVTLSVIKLAVLVTMVFVLVDARDLGIVGLVGSFFTAHTVFLLCALVVLYWQREPYKPDVEEMKGLVRYGLPLVFTSVITVLLATSDRFIIRHFHAFSDIGIYGTSAKVAGVVNFLILNAFFMGYTSIAFRKHTDDFFMNLQPTIIRFVSWLVMASIWFLSLFSEAILEILTNDDDYLLAHLYIPYFGVIIGFVGLQNFLAMAFHFANKTKKNIPIVTVALVVNIVLALVLVPIHPIYGALGSSIGSMFVMLVMTYHNSVKVYNDFVGIGNLSRIIFVILAGAGICALAIHLEALEPLLVRAILYVSMTLIALQILRIKPKMVIRTLRSWF